MRDSERNVLPCEIKAGGKHQDSAELRKAINDWLRDYTHAHGWEVKDNNALASRRKQGGTKSGTNISAMCWFLWRPNATTPGNYLTISAPTASPSSGEETR